MKTINAFIRLYAFVILVILFGGCASTPTRSSTAEKSTPLFRNDPIMPSRINAKMDGKLYWLYYSTYEPAVFEQELAKNNPMAYSLVKDAEQIGAFYTRTGEPKKIKGYNPYVLVTHMRSNIGVRFTSPGKHIDGTAYMYVFSNLPLPDLEKFLRNSKPASWRLASKEESERFEEYFGGQITYIENTNPSAVIGMQKYVMARIDSPRPTSTVASNP